MNDQDCNTAVPRTIPQDLVDQLMLKEEESFLEGRAVLDRTLVLPQTVDEKPKTPSKALWIAASFVLFFNILLLVGQWKVWNFAVFAPMHELTLVTLSVGYVILAAFSRYTKYVREL